MRGNHRATIRAFAVALVDIAGVVPVGVVPREGAKVSRLSQLHPRSRHSLHRVSRIVLASNRRKAVDDGRGVMDERPSSRRADERRRQLTHQNRGRLEVDALVLKGHEERPQRIVDVDGARALGERCVVLDHLAHSFVHLAPVRMHIDQWWPAWRCLREVVPRHLVDAHL